ncbi:MAG: CoA transferase [Acidobacteriota bacterium]|nr:CoA transferase [Acidobacteriota bacterium]
MSDRIKPTTSPRPLAGVTVLDLTIALAGPFATLLLAGLGAKVIKVENPLKGDPGRDNSPYLGREGAKLVRENKEDISVSALNRLRNKLGVTLNLKHPHAREVFTDLVRQADIVFENFSRGTMDRLGFGYEFVRQVNPRAVYCALTGFGSDAEAPDGKAMDTIIQALSGAMHTSGNPEDPPMRAGVPFADLITPLFAIIGTLAALRQAEQTGVGQFVDVSMMGAVTGLVASEHFDVLEQLGIPTRTGKTAPRLAPFGVYAARDGFVAICAPQDSFAFGIFRAMNRPELITDARFATRDLRVKHDKELDAMIETWTKTFSLADLLATLEANGVPSAEVRDPRTAVSDAHVVARGETVRLTHPKFGDVADAYGIGMPIRFSAASTGYDLPTPEMGEHNQVVYGGMLGYSLERIAALQTDGVI